MTKLTGRFYVGLDRPDGQAPVTFSGTVTVQPSEDGRTAPELEVTIEAASDSAQQAAWRTIVAPEFVQMLTALVMAPRPSGAWDLVESRPGLALSA